MPSWVKWCEERAARGRELVEIINVDLEDGELAESDPLIPENIADFLRCYLKWANYDGPAVGKEVFFKTMVAADPRNQDGEHG